MRTMFRQLFDRLFTGAAAGSVALLCLLLGIVLVPMLWRGMGAVIFRETIEFRKMQHAIFSRGSETELRRETAEVDALRKPIYAAFDSFADGIDMQKQLDRVREIYREYGDRLRQKNTPAEEFTQLRNTAKKIRDRLTEAMEATDKAEAIGKADGVLAMEKDTVGADPIFAEFFTIARRYKKSVEGIDPGHRQQYAQSLNEVREAMTTLFGPRPDGPTPPLAEQQYGATRWDLVRHMHSDCFTANNGFRSRPTSR